MGLITIEQIEDGTDASANGLNERFGIIADLLNGNIEAANMKNEAVTREKIAAGAVTSDKLDLERDVDERGWEYFTLGKFRIYVKKQSQSETGGRLEQNGYRYDRGAIDPPVGVTRDNSFWMSCTYTGGIQFMLKPYWQSNTKLASMIWNVGPAEFINYDAYWMIWTRGA